MLEWGNMHWWRESSLTVVVAVNVVDTVKVVVAVNVVARAMVVREITV